MRLACAIVVCLGVGIHAAEEIHVGVGTQSCGNWLRYRAVESDVTASSREFAAALSGMMKSWVQGFAVATAMAVDVLTDNTVEMPALRRVPDTNSIDAWIDKYCREQPLKTIEDAAVQLTKTLNASPK